MIHSFFESALECGLKNPIKTSKEKNAWSTSSTSILAGEESSEGEWPWMARLSRFGMPLQPLECGGAVLSEHFILTAAHCFSKKRSFL